MTSPLDSPDVDAVLVERIRAEGPITVSAYMESVAEAYYARGQAFGKEGDFVTAPEISQVFGELVGLWAVTAWQALEQPRNFHLVECGPGRGTLMADLARIVTNIAPRFMHSASIHLVERSEALRRQQAKALSDHHPVWHDDLSTLPDGPLIIIANEFLDALPIEQFVKTAAGWCERLVDHGPKGFSFVTAAMPSDKASDAFEDAQPGSILEQSATVVQLSKDLGALCVERPAVVLLIDYGYTASSIGETLQAVKEHKFHAVLEYPGEADITAHVDFATVAQAARSMGARIHGPVEQGLWLQRLGVKIRQAQLSEDKSAVEATAIDTSIDRLIAPEHMGTLFKAIAFSPTHVQSLAGFEANADLC